MLVPLVIYLSFVEGARLNCIHCEDFNKQQPSSEKCPLSSKECGDCIKGFQSVSWDKHSCLPIYIEILRQPHNVSGTIGQSVKMNCEFNLEEFKCEWEHAGVRISGGSGGRYHYLRNGQNCSLEIKALSKDDDGWWRCYGYSEFDPTDVAPSSKAWILTNNNVVVVDHPQHAVAQLKKRVVLQCKFNMPVKCQWLHKGRIVPIREGYWLLGIGDYEGRRTDCSIEISSFTKKDIGVWQCRNAPEGVSTVTSNRAYLFNGFAKKNNCHQKGQRVILNCVFEKPVPCSWKRNKQPVTISGRYKYLMVSKKGAPKIDCSLLIKKFSDKDSGQWACEKLANDKEDGKYRNVIELCPASSKITRKPRSLTEDMMPEDVSPVVIENPTTVSYNYSDTIIVPCKMSMEVSNCFWQRNDHIVEIENRYRYLDQSNNGQNTADCSLEIESFQDTDVGVWVCGSFADDEREGTVSKAGYLFLKGGDNFDSDQLLEFWDLEFDTEIMDSEYETEQYFPYFGRVAILECSFIIIFSVIILLLLRILKFRKMREQDEKGDHSKMEGQKFDGCSTNQEECNSSTTHLINSTD